jgi:hypothetical protein
MKSSELGSRLGRCDVAADQKSFASDSNPSANGRSLSRGLDTEQQSSDVHLGDT